MYLGKNWAVIRYQPQPEQEAGSAQRGLGHYGCQVVQMTDDSGENSTYFKLTIMIWNNTKYLSNIENIFLLKHGRISNY